VRRLTDGLVHRGAESNDALNERPACHPQRRFDFSARQCSHEPRSNGLTDLREGARESCSGGAEIREGVHLFQGVTDSTMTHGEGWQFIQAGRYLERTISVAMLVQTHFQEFYSPGKEIEPLEWIGLLASCTAFEAYCKTYTADLRPDRIAEFLVLSPTFPHSIRFSADALADALKQIGAEGSSRRASRVERIAGRMQSTLAFGQIDEIMSAGLHSYLDTVRRQCSQVYSALHQTYITYPIEAALGA